MTCDAAYRTHQLICAQVARAAAGLGPGRRRRGRLHGPLGGGVQRRVPLRALDPLEGPESGTKGQGVEYGACTPCNAARSQRNPTIADAIDAEIELRRQDPKRVASLKSGNIDYEDFREDLRSISKNR